MVLRDMIREILGRYLTSSKYRPMTGDFHMLQDSLLQPCYASTDSGIPSPFPSMERVVRVPIATE